MTKATGRFLDVIQDCPATALVATAYASELSRADRALLVSYCTKTSEVYDVARAEVLDEIRWRAAEIVALRDGGI